MDWRRKAQIQKVCAAVPRGDRLYARLQRRFGNLNPDPFVRVPHHIRMLTALRALDIEVAGARCMEVGTGHIPTLPLLFYLAGADGTTTVDLHRRLQWDLAGRAMTMLTDSADRLVGDYQGLIDEAALRQRLETMAEHAGRPEAFFDHAHIRYLAPGDAAAMPDPDGSVDLHFSVTVFEHIEPAVLKDVLVEAGRLLPSGGVACHIIDPSDHFAHSDASISLVNFLRFTAKEWDKIAGNEFGYCNRLRVPQLLDVFADAGMTVLSKDVVVDQRSLDALEGGFPVDSAFSDFGPSELAAITLDVVAAAKV